MQRQLNILSFADKVLKKMKTFLKVILACANPITKTDMKIADLIEGDTLNLELIFNIDRVRLQKSTDC